MLIRIFKTNYPAQVILFIVTAILLWMHGLLNPFPVDTNNLSQIQLTLLKPFVAVPFLGVITALTLTIVEALVFNQFLSAKEFVQRNTLLPAFLFLLLFSHGPHLLQVNALTVATPLLLLLLMLMIHLPDSSELYVTLFFSAFFTTVASFFYAPAIFFLAFIWVSFIVNGVFTWREWVISLLGGIMPIVFIWSWLYLNDQPDLLSNLVWPRYINPFSNNPLPPVPETIVSIMIGLMFMAAFRYHLSSLLENVLSFRRQFWTLTWFTIFALGSCLFSGQQVYQNLALVSIPAVALTSAWLLIRKRQRWLDVILLTLFILTFLQNQRII
ncbi:MAG TPA: hypothetical protein DCR43_03910 [Bacteroidales bacterium]|nr:MAG: hypothetical protein A2X11_00605 [Bacteroidetes bacterium GWE2_42_24]OFY27532.1 MAG: hypothetical protein A2X09_07620 [Bacteroidetes bacterium GWF2_43_11]PKP26034.1 MAG: hypothetical protein CVU06_03755 [Bacteroidetes bacterium HGW-Bacteroidetes-22]HAQ64988.1 hypothetical protein [Bacteroidales bacterium]HBZ66055.1 hypothetical protein [Bacteroidales bacterium]